ncbi:MAG: sigma-54 interaction domain-containing protein [Chromatiales bacterium]
MDEVSRNFDTEGLLRAIAEGTATATGERFFRVFLPCLGSALRVRYTFVATFDGDPPTARLLGFWDSKGQFDFTGGSYPLHGTPCETVLGGQMQCYPKNVQRGFPDDADLVKLGVESYLAIPLMTAAGTVMGHLAIMDGEPMATQPRDIEVLKIFAARVCAELERKRYKDALVQSEDRSSMVMASAMDAIITVDARRTIQLFNAAAERIFACSAAWATGQPFDRFISKPFRSLLEDYLKAADATGANKQPIWLSEGLTGVRANREVFPIEATISAVEGGGDKLYTIILRDVNERQHTRAELDRLQQQNALLREEMLRQSGFEGVIGDSPAMHAVLEAIAMVAPSDTTVLVTGETGTGKELVAHAIHHMSARNDKLLVKMNCAALPGELVESELFGHEKGAFTGAVSERRGRFELADGGTLFLDEVGELAAPAQAKLLRVLQEREFERVGGTRTIRVDVRVIAASNRNLAAMVGGGHFRSDLYYRLNVFPIELPPLRARASDIPPLVQNFLDKFGRKLGKSFKGLHPDSMQRLLRYDWPGNVRELQNVIERATVLSAGPMVVVNDILTQTGIAGTAQGFTPRTLEEVEAEHIRNVLESTDWIIEGKRGAAAILELEPSTLRYRMQKLGIRRPKPGAAAVD